jgi:hypothetical protein
LDPVKLLHYLVKKICSTLSERFLSIRLLLLGSFFILFIERLVGAQGARLLRDQCAYYLSNLLARHATRKLASTGFSCRRRSTNASLKMRLLKVQRAKEAHRPPRGKRVPGAEINHEQQSLRKQPSLKTVRKAHTI